ncbi:hypothetical protein [Pseudonocardia sp. N23]|uniref:hypothetical protein n=1 Tax=Pseudonocardia sp. N23 TaxID=1987376 RepID=UPI000BFD9460|nr:hypothetical protein [Pseudonocardia sp. N23]GAY10997.1 hypothetical protein TOK_5482 [Pseudonocardia sp. N23]
MITKAIVRGASTLAIAGLLAGFAATSAQAATPTTTAAPVALTAQTTAASSPSGPGHLTPAPQISKHFTIKNEFSACTLKLVSATGDNEGMPVDGSTMDEGSTQGFEVQYRAGNIGIINATYDIYQNGRPTKMGTFTVRMTYDWTGETSMAITSRSGDHDAHYTLLQPDDTDDAWVEFT